MIMKAVVANTLPFEFMGKHLQFTPSDLEDMLETVIGVPVTVDFDPTLTLGSVTGSEVKDGDLVVEMDMEGFSPDFDSPTYAALMVLGDNMRVMGIGLISNPAAKIPRFA